MQHKPKKKRVCSPPAKNFAGGLQPGWNLLVEKKGAGCLDLPGTGPLTQKKFGPQTSSLQHSNKESLPALWGGSPWFVSMHSSPMDHALVLRARQAEVSGRNQTRPLPSRDAQCASVDADWPRWATGESWSFTPSNQQALKDQANDTDGWSRTLPQHTKHKFCWNLKSAKKNKKGTRVYPCHSWKKYFLSVGNNHK